MFFITLFLNNLAFILPVAICIHISLRSNIGRISQYYLRNVLSHLSDDQKQIINILIAHKDSESKVFIFINNDAQTLLMKVDPAQKNAQLLKPCH